MPKMSWIGVTAVALVDKGANRKVFTLIKKDKGTKMIEKSLAVKMLKSQNLTEDDKKNILDMVDPSLQKEVAEMATVETGVKGKEEEIKKEVSLPEVAKLEERITALESKVEDILKAVTEFTTKADGSILCKGCGSTLNLKKAVENCPVCGAEFETTSEEISEDEFNKIIENAIAENEL